LSLADSSGVREHTPSVELRCLCLDQGPMIRTAGAVLEALSACMPRDAQGATGAIPGYHGGRGSYSCDGIIDGSGSHVLRKSGVVHEPGGAVWVANLSPSIAAGGCSSGGTSPAEAAALVAGALEAGARPAGAAATAARGVLRRLRSKGALVTIGNHIKLLWASITERPTPNTGGGLHPHGVCRIQLGCQPIAPHQMDVKRHQGGTKPAAMYLVNLAFQASHQAVILPQEAVVCPHHRVLHSKQSSHDCLGAVQLSSRFHPRLRDVDTQVVQSADVPRGNGAALWFASQVEGICPGLVGSQHGPGVRGGGVGGGG
jgi:hypothetical protein